MCSVVLSEHTTVCQTRWSSLQKMIRSFISQRRVLTSCVEFLLISKLQEDHQILQIHVVNEKFCEYLFDQNIW